MTIAWIMRDGGGCASHKNYWRIYTSSLQIFDGLEIFLAFFRNYISWIFTKPSRMGDRDGCFRTSFLFFIKLFQTFIKKSRFVFSPHCVPGIRSRGKFYRENYHTPPRPPHFSDQIHALYDQCQIFIEPFGIAGHDRCNQSFNIKCFLISISDDLIFIIRRFDRNGNHLLTFVYGNADKMKHSKNLRLEFCTVI